MRPSIGYSHNATCSILPYFAQNAVTNVAQPHMVCVFAYNTDSLHVTLRGLHSIPDLGVELNACMQRRKPNFSDWGPAPLSSPAPVALHQMPCPLRRCPGHFHATSGHHPRVVRSTCQPHLARGVLATSHLLDNRLDRGLLDADCHVRLLIPTCKPREYIYDHAHGWASPSRARVTT